MDVLEAGAIKSYHGHGGGWIKEHVMGHVDKRSITLSPELAAAVDDVVAAGEYASASEVIRDALRQWKDRRDLLGYTVEELRKLVQEGIESGPGRFASMDEIKAEARRRLRGDDAA
jgi:antitoxin ParD1/3/4